MKENKLGLYFNLFLGAIGPVTILLFVTIYMLKEQNSNGYIGMFGFLFIMMYINYLEKKAGISSKLIWMKAGFSIILFLSFSYFLYP